MFEILSTIGLTASAAIVIGSLAHAMAETPRGRLTALGVLTAWFALVVTIGASDALDPVRGFGVPALGLTVGLPLAALVSASSPSDRSGRPCWRLLCRRLSR